MDVGGRPGLLVEPALRGDVDLAAQDGLDAPGFGLLEELDGPEDVAMVGDGHGGHVLVVGRADEVADPQAAIEDAVFGMVMQVNECRFHERTSGRA